MHAIIASLALQSDGLTLRAILADIPRDPAAIFVYVLLIGAIGFIVAGSRRRSPAEREKSR